MRLNPNVRELRERLRDLGTEFEEDDDEYEGDDGELYHFEVTIVERGGHRHVISCSHVITPDNERVGVSKGWKFGFLELATDAEDAAMVTVDEAVEAVS